MPRSFHILPGRAGHREASSLLAGRRPPGETNPQNPSQPQDAACLPFLLQPAIDSKWTWKTYASLPWDCLFKLSGPQVLNSKFKPGKRGTGPK